MSSDSEDIRQADAGATEHTPLLVDNSCPEPPRTTQSPSVEELSSARLAIVFSSIWIIVVLTALDSTIVATLSATISTSFASFNSLSWLGTAYLVATAATQPLAGRFSDVYGRRSGLVISGLAFGIGTFLCGIASQEWVFILGRVIAGAGGGATNAISTFVGADLVPLRKRGVIQGVNNIAMGCGTGLGGFLGGLLNQLVGWKAAFLIQIPLVILGLVLCSTVSDIPSRPAQKPSTQHKIDYLGCFLLVAFIVLLLVGLNSGGNQVPWGHPLIWSTISASAVLLVIFIYVELRVAKMPVIPIYLMIIRTVWSGCFTYFFAHLSAFGTMYYIPIYLQLRGSNPTQAGLRFVTQSVGTAVGAYGSGLLIKATANYVYLSALSHAFLIVAAALSTTLSQGTPSWCPFLYLGMMGLGFGGVLVTTMLALISSVNHAEHAVVTSASFAFRAIGSSTGITMASAVFQNVLRRSLRLNLGKERENTDELIDLVRRNFDALWDLDPDIRQIMENGYMEALRYVFFTMLMMSVLSALCSSLMKQNKLYSDLARREQETGE